MFLQAKLTVGRPGDALEQEADRVAQSVMQMADPAPIGRAPAALQRKCAACEDRIEDDIQSKSVPSPDAESPVDAESAARAARQGGQPLTDEARSYFEPRFGYDFGAVRVHAGGEAAAAARSIHARAYTIGSDIVFGAGEYAPAAREGRRLLAHELAHVIQQGGGEARPAQGETRDTQRSFSAAGAAAAPSGLSAPRVQRQVDPNYVIDEPHAGPTPPGAPVRIFFARNSAAIPATETAKIDAFKSGADRTVDLTLLGLATEDELAVMPTLAADRANAVAAALAAPLALPPPGNTAHAGARTVTPGTLANTEGRPKVRFNRAVELLRPGQATMSPSTPIAAPTTCGAAIETAFQAAKVMAFQWIDTTRPEVQARPVAGAIGAELDRFFGNHAASTARRVDHNLGLIRDEIDSLAQPANHDCADPNLPGCVGAIAFNSGGAMTICAGYASRTTEDLARNLVHEAAHSTAGLRITGTRNAPRSSDFAYRHERLVHLLGRVNPDQALSNSDSYSMFLMTRRAPAAITPNLLPESDPAPSGFANAAAADKATRALAQAEVWIRLAQQGLTDLHSSLRDIGTGNPVPPDLGSPRRMDKILAQVLVRFPPILSTAVIRGDDLLMIAGVLDRYGELKRLTAQPIAASAGAATSLSAVAPAPPATTGSLALTVDAAFIATSDRRRARIVVDKLIELVPAARISVAMRANYGAFAEFVRDLHQ